MKIIFGMIKGYMHPKSGLLNTVSYALDSVPYRNRIKNTREYLSASTKDSLNSKRFPSELQNKLINSYCEFIMYV